MGLLKKTFKKRMSSSSSKFIGAIGERAIERKLKWVNFLGREGIVLRNVYIPKEDGSTSEIDLMYVTSKGIAVIESKNYSGYIFGNEENANWTVTLYAGKDFLGRNKVEKIKFYNPIKQNKNHIRYLKQYLGHDVQTFSIIVFSERCELKNITFYSDDTAICHKNDLPKIMKDLWSSYPDIYDQDDIEYLYDILAPLTEVNDDIRFNHIEYINDSVIDSNICPRCGAELVIRTARQGTNAGNQFYGCSNYPRCKYTRKI